MIRKLLGLVFNRWVLLAIIFVGLALTIWTIGPKIWIDESRPLLSETSRWIAIGVVGAVIAALVAWQAWRARRANAGVVNQLIAKPASDDAGERESPDLAAVRQRFEQAMQTLRRTRFGQGGLVAGWSARLNGRYVYEMPWYLIIGAPGSGKTTALEHCGLQFPLKTTLGQSAVRGVGGTRNCDWWFTDQAVLIDTAGRFVTQDSDAANDRATWSGFLQMLKRSRPRQPVNGVLVTVSVPDLLGRGPDERQQYAATVRQRIQELNEDLGIRIPIYLLVTKCDLIAGFMDYFAALDKDQRAAAWGTTFAFDKPTADHLKTFGPEFAALLKRLDDGLVEQLQAERDPRRRARIYGFPNQFACIQAPLQQFLETVFSPSPYEQETLLRGVYFISGTQEGTPIDRVMGSVSRAFGLERAMVAPNQAVGKSFFLTRLLGDVVFAERGLAGTNLKWEQKRRLLAVGAYAMLAALTVGLLAAWTVSYFGNRRYVDEVAARATEVRKSTIAAANLVSADVWSVAPTLDAMRSLSATDESSWKLGFGLSQQKTLKAAERNAYDRMLTALLLPSLELSVENRIAREYAAPENQYESLKTYLMLHDAAHFDAPSLKAYFVADWNERLGRAIDANQRASLENHLDNLLAQGASRTLRMQDKGMVDGLRERITLIPLPQRVFNRMRAQGLGSDFPDVTVKSAGGSAAVLLFSDDTLARRVPGLYTYDGYHKGFDAQVRSAAQQLSDEQSWVLGVTDTATRGQSAFPGNVVETQVRTLYLQQYAATWRSFIDGIRLKTLGSPTFAIQVAQQLSGPDTPLRPLMRKVAHETSLSVRDSGSLVGDLRNATLDKGASLVKGLGGPKLDANTELERQLVDDQFTGIHNLVTPGPDGKAPLDQAIAQIAEVQGALIAADKAVKAAMPPPPMPSTVAASQLPEPVKTVLTALSDQGAQQNYAGIRANLSNEVRAQMGDFCKKAFEKRYPFDRSATLEVQQQDFMQVFGPGGKFDQLMIKLGPYVDTSARTWKLRPVEGAGAGGESASLVQLQRAQAIRDAFFPGVASPVIRVTFKPVEMDPQIALFSLDIDGQSVRYQHGPLDPSTIAWPGPRGTNQVRLLLTPAPPVGTPDLVFDGPWALWRMIDRVKIDPTPAPERFIATFNVAQRWAKFEVSALSVRNPLNMAELRDFRCPMGL